jgi:hypothetical protein
MKGAVGVALDVPLMQALMKTGGASFVWNWQLEYTACIDANQDGILREHYL